MTLVSFSFSGRLLFYNVLYSQVSLGSTECSAQHEDSARGRSQSPITALSVHAPLYENLELPPCSSSVELVSILESEYDQIIKIQRCLSSMNFDCIGG